MRITIDGCLEAIQNSATAPLEAVQKGTTAAIGAIQRFFDIKGHPLAVLNGVIGDTLASQGSKLAIQAKLLGKPGGKKICILVHGLCASEETWEFSEDAAQNYGSLLQRDLGYAPLYLHYNSGLHISTNGRLLAGLLDDVFKNSSTPIKEIIFIGHSMGGLVVRSACHYGQKNKSHWVKRVKKIFLLGTPHHGNDYEKLGNLASKILRVFSSRVEALGNKRSAGIKDLRFGNLLDEDWKGHDADALWKDNRHPVPLLPGVDYYVIAATLAKKNHNLFTQYFGDGMIPTHNAAGWSFRKSKTIPFSPRHFKCIRGVSHVRLAAHRKVYKQIFKWCASRTFDKPPSNARRSPLQHTLYN